MKGAIEVPLTACSACGRSYAREVLFSPPPTFEPQGSFHVSLAGRGFGKREQALRLAGSYAEDAARWLREHDCPALHETPEGRAEEIADAVLGRDRGRAELATDVDAAVRARAWLDRVRRAYDVPAEVIGDPLIDVHAVRDTPHGLEVEGTVRDGVDLGVFASRSVEVPSEADRITASGGVSAPLDPPMFPANPHERRIEERARETMAEAERAAIEARLQHPAIAGRLPEGRAVTPDDVWTIQSSDAFPELRERWSRGEVLEPAEAMACLLADTVQIGEVVDLQRKVLAVVDATAGWRACHVCVTPEQCRRSPNVCTNPGGMGDRAGSDAWKGWQAEGGGRAAGVGASPVSTPTKETDGETMAGGDVFEVVNGRGETVARIEEETDKPRPVAAAIERQGEVLEALASAVVELEHRLRGRTEAAGSRGRQARRRPGLPRGRARRGDREAHGPARARAGPGRRRARQAGAMTLEEDLDRARVALRDLWRAILEPFERAADALERWFGGER